MAREPGRSPRPAGIPGHGSGGSGIGLRRKTPRETAPAPGRVRRAQLHCPPSTPDQTLQRFILKEQRSAASEVLLCAGQEKWVFNRQGRRAWQPATAAGEINKQRSCGFRSEQKLRSRREEPAARSADRACSRSRSRRGKHVRPPTPRPPTSPRSKAPGLCAGFPQPRDKSGLGGGPGACCCPAGPGALPPGWQRADCSRPPLFIMLRRCCTRNRCRAARSAPGKQAGRECGVARSRSGGTASH